MTRLIFGKAVLAPATPSGPALPSYGPMLWLPHTQASSTDNINTDSKETIFSKTSTLIFVMLYRKGVEERDEDRGEFGGPVFSQGVSVLA